MAKKFSKEDMKSIKSDLQRTCEESWKIRGYKQTNIPLLTKKVGISAGAFYLLYKSKEDLFIEVLEKVQANLLNTWLTFIHENEHKIEGFKLGLQWLYHEYQKYPALYNFNSSEYDLFLAKLPKEKVDELKKNSLLLFSKTIQESKLKLLLPEEEVIHIIHSILFLALVDMDTLVGNEQTFNFLLEHSLYNLFEEE
ncbi:hypothetical protein IGI39_000358 [Enterococcus sp. AZ135]|uniref:TetR/AcrR family transcriptional regulator n=1 Tax=unclassified Enterococcus TaxID=2608891 RepID=UPI003F237068